MEVSLNPSSYKCPSDDNDLTEDVKIELSVQGLTLTAQPRAQRREKSFTVIIDCPGKDQKSPHEVEVQGKYTIYD